MQTLGLYADAAAAVYMYIFRLLLSIPNKCCKLVHRTIRDLSERKKKSNDTAKRNKFPAPKKLFFSISLC